MSKQPDLASCKTGADFIRQLHGHPAIRKEHWSGDHYTVWGPDGRETLCNSHRELPPFVRRRIAKAIIAIGLACLILIPIFLNLTA